MYINPFVAGIITTFVAETVIVISLLAWIIVKESKVMEVYVRYKDGTTQTIKRVSSWNYSKELNAYVFKVENDTYAYREKNRTIIIGREQVELVSIREA